MLEIHVSVCENPETQLTVQVCEIFQMISTQRHTMQGRNQDFFLSMHFIGVISLRPKAKYESFKNYLCTKPLKSNPNPWSGVRSET